jgi:hypothetical protein
MLDRDIWKPGDLWQVADETLARDRWSQSNFQRIPICVSVGIPWKRTVSQDKDFVWGWNLGAEADVAIEKMWEDFAENADGQNEWIWQNFKGVADAEKTLAWQEFSATADSAMEWVWKDFPVSADSAKTMRWCDYPETCDGALVLPWSQYSASADSECFVAWAVGDDRDLTRFIATIYNGGPDRWKEPDVWQAYPSGRDLWSGYGKRFPALDVPFELLWGCGVNCDTDLEIKTPAQTLQYQAVNLSWASGMAQDKAIRLRWIRKILIMFTDSVVFKRVYDDLILPLESFSIDADIGSYDFKLTAKMPDRGNAQLVRVNALSENDLPGPVETELTFNGKTWRFYIESLNQEFQHGSGTYSISGRSKACKLGSPYAPILTQIFSATDSQQLIADLLDEFNWEAVYDERAGFDVTSLFSIPADLFSCQGKTAIEVIGDLISAIGGVVQSHPANDELILMSRFPYSPKNFGLVTPEHTLNLNRIFSHSQSWSAQAKHQYVIVSGRSDGVLVHVVREGADPAAAVRKNDAVHDLILDQNLAQERGRVELDETGYDKMIHRLELPFDAAANYVAPGSIVEVSDLFSTWRGLSVNNRLTMEKGGLQAVEIHQYITE